MDEKKEEERLEWIETFRMLHEREKNESGGLSNKMTERIKANPFVPIGMIATTLALSYGLYAMRTGNKRRSQLMMRTRVIAQGFTIVALVIGVAVGAAKKPT